MDARKEFAEPDGSTRPATANDWTLDLNKIEDELKRVRGEEHSLNAHEGSDPSADRSVSRGKQPDKVFNERLPLLGDVQAGCEASTDKVALVELLHRTTILKERCSRCTRAR
jgi:hypothetical protein